MVVLFSRAAALLRANPGTDACSALRRETGAPVGSRKREMAVHREVSRPQIELLGPWRRSLKRGGR
jgi:hypothetical protein